jgi:hypothetical protein
MEWFLALDIARKIIKNPMQVPSHIKERNNTENESIRLQIRYTRNQLFEKKRSVAEATMYECYGIGPRRCILGP